MVALARIADFMRLRRTWICDSCAQTILAAEEGWVEWLVRQEGERQVGRGMRLVHHATAPGFSGCQYQTDVEQQRDGSLVHDCALADFVTDDGLIQLLAMIAGEEVPTVEVLEMIERLHIPGYEYARLHFEAAINDGVFVPNTRPGYYSTSQINLVNAWRVRQPGQGGG
jgi:hypothetical protein